MDSTQKQEFADFIRAQEQAFAVLTGAIGDIVGSERLTDAISGRLIKLKERDGENQLLAAAMLSSALQELQRAHLLQTGAALDGEEHSAGA